MNTNEILDHKDKQIIEFRTGSMFSGMAVYAGYGIFVFSIILPVMYGVEGFYPWVIFVPLGAFLTFSYTGTLISENTKEIKHYSAYLGFLKSGKWLNLDDYPFISVLKQRMANSYYGRSGVSTTQYEYVYRILLLNNTHYKKLYIKDFETYKEAEKVAKELVEKLNVELVKYAPKRISKRR